MGLVKGILRLLVKVLLVLFIVAVSILLLRALDSRGLPDLAQWHRIDLEEEFRKENLDADFDLADYRRKEERLLIEFEHRVLAQVIPSEELRFSRYLPLGVNNPLNFPKNYNRTFELVPEKIRGGALLLHGLTDSPYSLRRCGEILADQGFYVLGLRLPGHGTIPAALTTITWQDWLAAAKIGATHVRNKIGAERPFFLVGYSNGGALSVKYTLEALESDQMPKPDQLILFSPAIGVTKFAILGRLHKALSFIPYFEKFRWQSVDPEYDPYKYNSFPKNAGYQTYRLSMEIDEQLQQHRAKGLLADFPPVLTFQSLVDSTVLTDAIVHRLYNRLAPSPSELVLFDINRLDRLRPFISKGHRTLLDDLTSRVDRPYIFTFITNAAPTSEAVVARTKKAGSASFEVDLLTATWPPEVYSLSHVAIPFPPDDPLYGNASSGSQHAGLSLGALAPRGERNILQVSVMQLMRLRHNPFYGYIEKRLRHLAVETSYVKAPAE